MKRLNPHSLSGPRTYFTAFDPRIIQRNRSRTTLRNNIERRLKILLLIKSKVICAASHLASHFSYELFKDNPRLLAEGHLIPALRTDKTGLDDLFETKTFKGKKAALAFYHDVVTECVSWELEDNSNWFKDRFVEELSNNKSLVRRGLQNAPSSLLEKLTTEINSNNFLARDQVENVAKLFSPTHRRLLLNFRDLLYHISGARVVNCESSLPQENYIDFDIADLSQKRTKLSDEMILWKLFIESVLESTIHNTVPIETIDLLSFNDILSIREPILNSDFQHKYDKLLQLVTPAENIELLELDKLDEIRESLIETFQNAISNEIEHFFKRKKNTLTKGLARQSSAYALGFLSFIPIAGNVATAAGLAIQTPSLFVNVTDTISSLKSLENVHEYSRLRNELLKKRINCSDISNKSAFLDIAQLIFNTMSYKLKI